MRTVIRSFAAAVVVALVGFVTACAAKPAPDGSVLPAAPGSSAVSSSSAAPAGSNAQGRIPKKLGEAAGFTTADGTTQVVTFSIDKIAVDPKCDEYMPRTAGSTHS